MNRQGVCLVGYGEIPNHMPDAEGLTSSFSYLPYVAEAVSLALDNAGLKKKEKRFWTRQAEFPVRCSSCCRGTWSRTGLGARIG